jgi:hypothetical protein
MRFDHVLRERLRFRDHLGPDHAVLAVILAGDQ